MKEIEPTNSQQDQKQAKKLKTLIVNVRRRQTIKCQRKKNLVKKCYELAKLCDLKINLVVFNQEANCLQQYSSHQDFKIADIRKKVEQNKHLQVKTDSKKAKTSLKKNFVESMLLDTYLKQEGIPIPVVNGSVALSARGSQHMGTSNSDASSIWQLNFKPVMDSCSSVFDLQDSSSQTTMANIQNLQ